MEDCNKPKDDEEPKDDERPNRAALIALVGVLVATIASSYFSWDTGRKLDEQRETQRKAELRALNGSFAVQEEIVRIAVDEQGDEDAGTRCAFPGPTYLLDTTAADKAGDSVEAISDAHVQAAVFSAIDGATQFDTLITRSQKLTCGGLVAKAATTRSELAKAREQLGKYLKTE